MSTATTDALIAPTDQPITFIAERSPGGQATLALTWKYDDETLRYLAEHADDKTKLLLVVAAVNRSVWHDDDGTSVTNYSYDTTSAKLVDVFTRSGKPLPAKAYVSFNRAGEHIVLGKIIRVSNAHDDRILKESMRDTRNSFRVSTIRGYLPEFNEYYVPDVVKNSFRESFMVVEDVPATLFAKEPPRVLKSLVRQFYPDRERDQCHFRKRVLMSVPLAIVVQAYGIPVRLVTFLVAVIVGCRNIFSADFFAFNPHDYKRSLQKARYLDDGLSDWRTLGYFMLVPIGPIVTAVLLGVLWLIGVGALFAWSLFDPSIREHGFWQPLPLVLLADVILAIVITATVMLVTRGGRATLREFVTEPVGTWAEKIAERRTARLSVEEQMLAQAKAATRIAHQLFEAQQNITSPAQVENSTVRLMFESVKRGVCKPFQAR